MPRALLILVLAAYAAPALAFLDAPYLTFDAGRDPFGVAVGDFDADGRADLAVANRGSNSVSVLLGNGERNFKAAGEFETRRYPVLVTVADMNADGRADLVVGADAVSVHLGNGDGTFETVPATGDQQPRAIAVADLNGDGLPDLAVADPRIVRIYLGRGDGTVVGPLELPGTGPVQGIAVADIDRDGHADVIAGAYDTSVFRGIGDGTFAPRRGRAWRAGSWPWAT